MYQIKSMEKLKKKHNKKACSLNWLQAFLLSQSYLYLYTHILLVDTYTHKGDDKMRKQIYVKDENVIKTLETAINASELIEVAIR